MSISKENKLKIAARLFYDDNKDIYENYEEALKEATENFDEKFLEFTIANIIEPNNGYRKLISPVGHVIQVRTSDDFCEPLTDMSHEENKKLISDFQKMSEQKDATTIVLLQELNWVLL